MMKRRNKANHEIGIPLDVVSRWPGHLPPRSELCRIPYQGNDGHSIEDLISYNMRLCDAHSLAPATVANKLVASILARRAAVRSRNMAELWDHPAVNGKGNAAREWSTALNELTRSNDLQNLTLLSLRDIVPDYQLLSHCQRYCPACYLDDERHSRPTYNRLLWVIAVVTACPIHGVRLLHSCHRCEVLTSAHARFFVPGFCADCGIRLCNNEAPKADAFEVDIATRVGEFLDHSRLLDSSIAGAAGVASFLHHVRDVVAGGEAKTLADMLGTTKTNVHGWMLGTVMPSFPAIVRMAQIFDCPVSDVLQGNQIVPRLRQASAARLTLRATARTNRDVDKDEVRNRLEEISKGEERPTLSVAAASVGVSVKYIQRNFPDLHVRIVSRSTEQRRLETAHRRSRKEARIVGAREELANEGIYPSRRRIEARLKADGIRLGRQEAINLGAPRGARKRAESKK